jgi:hypothetical protein
LIGPSLASWRAPARRTSVVEAIQVRHRARFSSLAALFSAWELRRRARRRNSALSAFFLQQNQMGTGILSARFIL